MKLNLKIKTEVQLLDWLTDKFTSEDVYKPVLADLYSLYHTVRSTKSTSILEIGSGWSTLVLAQALLENRDDFGSNFKFQNPNRNAFVLKSIDASEYFASIASERLNEEQREIVEIIVSTPRMSLFEGRMCHEFDLFPNFAADLIYLDGPDCDQVIGEIAGVSVNTVDSPGGYNLPMAADILRIEFFLEPGCQIIVDGRGANAEFLRACFRREWEYEYKSDIDQHFFRLVSSPWGKRNIRHLER
jgi:hypothetical protein